MCQPQCHSHLQIRSLRLCPSLDSISSDSVVQAQALTLALTGTYAIKGPFWALSTEWLAGSTAAAGIAQVNALANLGAFAGSYLLGVIKDATGTYPLALLPLVALSAAGSIAVLLIGRGQPRIVAAAGAAHH